jgi:hypothetical protein
MRTPTWVTLKGVPSELLDAAHELVGSLGQLLGSDQNNALSADQRFCVALSTSIGWKTQVNVRNEITRRRS